MFWCNFEGTEADWCDMNNTDSWIKRTGPTPFPDTGPDGAAYDGTGGEVYVYQTAMDGGSTHR